MYGGYIATSINIVAGHKAIAYGLEHSQSRLIIADEKGKAAIAKGLSLLHLPPSIVVLDAKTLLRETLHSTYDLSASSDGLLMYTSRHNWFSQRRGAHAPEPDCWRL